MDKSPSLAPGLAEFLWRLIPPVAALVLYAPALFNGFVWDDWVALVELPYLSDAEREWLILAGNQLFSANYFRPITTLSHLIELRLFDPYPVYFHLTNIGLHATNTLLLTLIARRFARVPCGRANLYTFAVPLLYACHPALVEPVAWISARVDLLVTFFLLLAFWLDLVVQRTWLRGLLVALSFGGALLSKEMAATFPALLIVFHLAYRRASLFPLKRWWQAARAHGDLFVYGCLLGMFTLYLIARYRMLGTLLVNEGAPPHAVSSLSDRIILVGASIAELLRITSGPLADQLPLHFLETPLSLASNQAWLGLLVLAAMTIWLVIVKGRLSPLGWLWLAVPISLLPVSNLIPILTGPGFIAERFMAFPLTLICLALPLTVVAFVPAKDRARDSQLRGGIALGLLAIWLLASSVAVVRQTQRWQDDLSLWSWTASRLPHAGYAHMNLIHALKRQTRFEDAIVACQQAIDLVEPRFIPELQRQLGFLYLLTGRPEAAIREFEITLKNKAAATTSAAVSSATGPSPADFDIYISMGNALMELQRDREALRYFELARDLKPEEAAGHYNLGLYHLEHHEPARAIESFTQALKIYQAMRPSRHNQLQIARGIMNTEKMLDKARTAWRNQ
jgi:hypothetical protein